MKRPPHRVIYTHGGGRLGNQILRWAHWLAWAQVHAGEVEVVNVGFWPYAYCFERWRENPGCAYPQPSRIANLAVLARRAVPATVLSGADRRGQHFLHGMGNWWPGAQAIALDDPAGESINLDEPAFFERVAQRSVTMCSGWKIAGWRLFADRQAQLRCFFQPAPRFARPAQAFIRGLRQHHDFLAGVLIRGTDYRHWFGGRFYFPASRYAEWIRQLLDLHPGRRVGVVIASDEWQDPQSFAGLPCHFATGSVNAGGHAFESFAELSLCDVVLSPPSTFGATAAYVGGVPLWPLSAADEGLALEDVLPDALVGAARHPVFSHCVQ